MVELREEFGRLFQRDLFHAWGAGQLLDRLVHPVQTGPREVGPWVWQLLGIVGLRRLHQGEITFGLQVRDEDAALPVRAVLNEKLRQHGSQRHVFNN